MLLGAILSLARVANSVLNDWRSEDGLDALMVVLQGESLGADNLGRVECGAFVTKIGCAGGADEVGICIFDLLAFLSAHLVESSLALRQSWNGDFSELARDDERLNFNVANALLSFKLAIVANFAGWFASDALAG